VEHWRHFATGDPIAPIDDPIAPIDDPIAPIDDGGSLGSSSSDPVVSISNPGPITDPLPIFPPAPVSSPIPETSTEVMFIIGFGIVALASRRRALNSIKHDLVETLYKIAKRPFHHYTS
jgi:hypothetical protein